MFKLNEKGFGIFPFLTYLLVLIVSLFVVVKIVNKYDIAIDSKSLLTSNSQPLKEDEYKDEESKDIAKSAVEYLQSNYPTMPEGDYIHIDINNLNVSEEIKKECSGYVEISYDYYAPDFKCKK